MRILDLATLSLVGGSGIAEAKVPLWWSDGTTVSTTQGAANACFVFDGTAPFGTSTPANYSQSKIFTLSATWNSSQKYALEVTLYTGSATYNAYVNLYDITSSSAVSGSQIATTSTTSTLVRSGQLTLTPGHTYGIAVWNGTTSSNSTTYIVDASLIIFP